MPDAPERVVAPGSLIPVDAPPGGVPLAALDGGMLRPLASPLRAPASGVHWLATSSRDGSGRTAPPSWVRLRVEGPPVPLLALAAPGAADVPPGGRVAIREGEEVRIVLGAAAPAALLEVSLAGRRFAGTPHTVVFYSWGEHVLAVRARDASGREVEACWTVSVAVRGTP